MSIKLRAVCGITTVALAAGVILASGCSKKASSPAASNESTAGWTLVLTVAPAHPRMVRPATLSLHIADSNGKPVENARLTASLTMTFMDMGKTELKFEPKGRGGYAASVQNFDMSGPWELTVDAVQGAVQVHKTFQFTVYD